MGKPNQNQNKSVQNQSITHFSHPHRLSLTAPSSPTPPPCYACNLPVGGGRTLMYSCRPCNFALHVSCAQMPRVMTHPSHPHHRLSLLAVPAYIGGRFNCDACGLNGTGFSYHCSNCEFDVHALCANMPLSVRDGSHPQHPLKLLFESPYGPNGFSCDVCGEIGTNQWLYRCVTCEFDAHVGCITNAQPQPHLNHVSSVPVGRGGGGYDGNLRQNNSFPGPNGGNVRPIRPIGGNIRSNGSPGRFSPNVQSGYPGAMGQYTSFDPIGQNDDMGLHDQNGPILPVVQLRQNLGPGATSDGGYGYDEGDSYGEVGDATHSESDFGAGESDLGSVSGTSGGLGEGDDVYGGGGGEVDDLYPTDVENTQSNYGPQNFNQNMAMGGPVITRPGNNRYGPTGRPGNMNQYNRPSGSPRITNRFGVQPKALGMRRQNNSNGPQTTFNGPRGFNYANLNRPNGPANGPAGFNYVDPSDPNGPNNTSNGLEGSNDPNGPINSDVVDQVGQDPGQVGVDNGGYDGGMADEGDMYAGDDYSGYDDETYGGGDEEGSVYGESYYGSDIGSYVDIGGDDGGSVYGNDNYDGGDDELFPQATDEYMQYAAGFGNPSQSTPTGPVGNPNPSGPICGPGPRNQYGPRPTMHRNMNMNGLNNGQRGGNQRAVQTNAMSRRTQFGPNAPARPNGPNGPGNNAMMNLMVQGLCQGIAQNMLGNNDGGDASSVATSVLGGLFGGDSESQS